MQSAHTSFWKLSRISYLSILDPCGTCTTILSKNHYPLLETKVGAKGYIGAFGGELIRGVAIIHGRRERRRCEIGSGLA